jgi:ABC-type multidrug transport system ATPase subunit
MRLLRRRIVLLLYAWRVSKVTGKTRKSARDVQHEHARNASSDVDGLVWEHLSVTGSRDAVILHSFSGKVPAGQLCGILGPSGSGKSTFLSALGCLLTLPVDGRVYRYQQAVKGKAKPGKAKPKAHDKDDATLVYQRISSNQVAWLQQHDDFFSMLTVRETLDLAAYLELPHRSAADRAALVQGQLRTLGLSPAAHRLVGEASSTSGARISGGERRRLAVALELLTDKQLLLADEATSGLDASMSHKVVDLLRQVAVDRHIPVVLSLHQPRSSIWKLLDHVIVMAVGGHVCYAGRREDCLPYFADLGYPCPSETNPAEFLMDLVSIGEDPQDKERVHHLIEAFVEYQAQDPGLHMEPAVIHRETNSSPTLTGPWHVFRRFGALLRRSWRQNIRNTGIHTFRLVASALNAVLLAAIFPSVMPGQPPSPSSVADRVALLSFGAINMCFIAFMKVGLARNSFPMR